MLILKREIIISFKRRAIDKTQAIFSFVQSHLFFANLCICCAYNR